MAFQLYPSFNFNESNVGPRPVRSVTRQRVGMAGVFKYAPASPAVADPDTAKKLFGADESVGSAHMQAILAQGVPDILVSPVRPAARVATLAVTLTGTTSATGTIIVSVDPGFSGTILTSTTINVASGATAATIAAQVVAATNAIVGAAATCSQPDPLTGALIFTATTAGANGNSVKIQLTTTSATGLIFNPTGVKTALTALAGGIDAPKAASVTLASSVPASVLTLTALPIGTTGNGIVATVAASLTANRFDLTLTHSVLGITETYRDVDLTDVYDDDKLTALRSSLLANGQVISSTNVPVPGSFSFTSGSDGDTTLVTQDYLDALAAMNDIQCTVICVPGIKANTISQLSIDTALVAQAENGDTLGGEINGLRIAVTSTPRNSIGKNTYVADFATLRGAGKILNSKRNVNVVGWGTSASVQKFKRFGIDPAAPYAGHLVMTDEHISPAARTSSPTIKGILETDCPTSVPALNEITRNRCEAIYYDPTMNAHHCLNGRTTSTDPAWYWVCIRRITDVLRTDIFFNFQWSKSEPSSGDLDRRVQSGVDAYLDGKRANGEINGYNPTVSNDTNNKDRTQPRMVDIYIEYVYPNDQTQWNINRVQRASIRIA